MKAARGRCAECDRPVSVRVPKGGDGSMLVPYPHNYSGRRCDGEMLEARPREYSDAELKRKFGGPYILEMREIESTLQHLPPAHRHLAAVAEYQRRHKNDPSMRERQEAARERGEKWVTPTRRPAPERLTEEEITYLVDRLQMVNDPTGQAILDKLAAML